MTSPDPGPPPDDNCGVVPQYGPPGWPQDEQPINPDRIQDAVLVDRDDEDDNGEL